MYDKANLIKDIADREKIVLDYQTTGFLDRDRAIEMIIKLRLSDEDVARATTVTLLVSSVPFSQATDQGIVEELKMQIGILSEKLMNG